MIELLVVAPTEKFKRQLPRGFSFADEVFAEAKLSDPISAAQMLTSELRRALSYLAHRYPHRIRTRWVDLWSPGGLWVVFRFKLRSFPVVILNQKEILTGERLQFQPFSDYMVALLSQPRALIPDND